MNRDVKDLIAWARDRGWRVVGQPRSHIKMQRGQVVYTIPSTPSDYRSLINSRAEMLRLTGDTEDKPNAGRPRAGLARNRQRFSMDAALAERDRRQAALDRAQEQREEAEVLRHWLAHREGSTRLRTPAEVAEIASARARYRRIVKWLGEKD